MTTAHRPTWTSALGSGSNPSGGLFVANTTKVSNRDAANFTTIKTRKVTQGAPEERGSRREYREDLERRERKAKDEREGKKGDKDDKDKRRQDDVRLAIEENPFPEDADDDEVPEQSDKSDKESDNEDDEDTEELMRELAKIKKEREFEEEARREAQRKQDERSRRDEIMRGNPLLQAPEDCSLKRKWDDDTVFKNQARTAPKEKLRYINDAVRSDFHRKFLHKYVWVDGTAH